MKQCPKCASSNDNRKIANARVKDKIEITMKNVWDALGLIVLGPFEETTNGNHEVCLLIDYASKFVYGEPTFSRAPTSIVKVIRNACYQYGVPELVCLVNMRSCITVVNVTPFNNIF